MSIFSKVIGVETVLGESADVYLHKKMDFASNYVIGESPNCIDLGLSPAHTTYNLKSIIGPATRVEGFTDISDWILSRHGIEEVAVGRVIKAKAYSDYTENSEFEITKIFEWMFYL